METKGFMRGTLVMTEKGPLPIEQVKIGDKVLTSHNRWKIISD